MNAHLFHVAVSVMLTVLLSGCPPECSRQVIAGNGQVEDGGHLRAEFFPYGVDGFDVTGTVWAPLSACPGDRVTARASFQAANGDSTSLAVGALTVHDGGAVSGVLTVPAQPLGAPGVLKVDFEPALGQRTTVVTVLPRAALDGTVVRLGHLVSDCRTPLTAIDSQTVGCRIGAEFVASIADGGEVRFTAHAPVALEGVVWSVADDGFLEYREFDGGMVLLQRGPATPPDIGSARALFSRELGALQSNSGLAARRLIDGGIVLVSHTRLDGNEFRYLMGPLTYCSQCDWDAIGIDFNFIFRWKISGRCFPDPGNARCEDNVVGIDAWGPWSSSPAGTGLRTGRPLVGHRAGSPEFPPNGFGELVPWFPAAGDYRAFARPQVDGGVSLAAFPSTSVVSATASFVVVRVSDSEVVIVGR